MRVIKTRFLHIAFSLFACLAGLLMPVRGCAADTLILSREREIAIFLRHFVDVYEDRSGEAGIDRIRQLAQNNPTLFQPLKRLRQASAYTHSAWWLRATVENRSSKAQPLVLLAGPPNLEEVDFFLKQQGTWRHARAGTFVPVLTQQDMTRYPTLRFWLQPGESAQVLWRVKSHSPFHLNPVLYSLQTFRGAAITTVVSDGILIGGMGALAWCAFLISAITRRLPFLWLSALAGAAALREAMARAYIQRLFLSLESAWSYRMELTLHALCLALFAMFVHSVARRSAVQMPGSGVYAAMAAILLACAVSTTFVPLYAATLITLVAGAILAGSMLASSLLLTTRSRATAVLLGISAILVVLDIVVRATDSLFSAPWIPASLALESGTPLVALLLNAANLAVLTLWAAHSLGRWRCRHAPQQCPARATLPPHDGAQLPSDSQAVQTAQPSPYQATRAATLDIEGSADPPTPPPETNDESDKDASLEEVASRQAMILSYVGHDLRAPLATISGYTRLLRQAAAPTQHAYLDVIERSVGYQFSLIEEILAYTKLELQPFSVAPEETRLPVLLEELARFGVALCTHNGNSFEYLPAPTLPAMVSLDRKRLRQAVLNLLSNAAKFTREGTVRFEARVQQSAPGSELHLHVFNDGPNIAPEDQEKIFSAFRQLRRREAGMGLGLFIVERIAHGMGGEVRLESSPEFGNRFSLIVPVTVTDPTAVPSQAIRHQPAQDAYARHLDAPPLAARLALAKLARDGELSEIEKWIEETHIAHPECLAFYEEAAACIENFDMERLQRLALLGIA